MGDYLDVCLEPLYIDTCEKTHSLPECKSMYTKTKTAVTEAWSAFISLANQTLPTDIFEFNCKRV